MLARLTDCAEEVLKRRDAMRPATPPCGLQRRHLATFGNHTTTSQSMNLVATEQQTDSKFEPANVAPGETLALAEK
eukprot:s5132_g4.t1